MRLTLMVLWLISTGIIVPCMSRADVENRVALVIGNSDYVSVPSLDNPINDASDIAIALEGLGFEVLLGSNANRGEMIALAGAFEDRARDADAALFYYAGHGFQIDGENYLVPTDAKISGYQDVAQQTVLLKDIVQTMERSNGIGLVFLDACRDNPFGTTGLSKLVVEEGLAKVGSAAGFLFAYATQPDNVAYDGSGRNSFFTEALLSHIYTPGQDISDLMISVRRDVLAATGGRQIPWENSSLTRSFRFDNSPATASEETLLWQLAVNSGETQLMQLYQERYPQGSHLADVAAFLDDDNRALPAPRNLAVEGRANQAARLWELARRSRMRPLLEFYVRKFPDSENVSEATQLLQSIPPKEDTTPGGICERLATHPQDRTARLSGVPFEQLRQNAITAIRACSAAAAQFPELPHYTALLARATAAAGDLERAIQLYQLAAGQGDVRAMVSLAQLRENGTGMPKDASAAVSLYEQAAQAGSSDAMINLAVLHFEGTIVAQDTARAIQLLQAAADQGSAKATFNLGVLAQDKLFGTPEQALDLFQKAAREGEYQGYLAAAILLDEGRGVSRNPDLAANMLLRVSVEDNGSAITQLTARPSQWSRDTLSAIQSRLKAAGYYDSTIDGLPGPAFASALKQWRNGGFVAEVLVE